MSQKNVGKVIAVGVGAVCLSAVGIMGVYLPFYSNTALQGADARRELHKLNLGQDPETPQGVGSQKAGLAPSSMWKNIDAQQKSHRRGESEE